jgi:hypothetical protein
MIEVRCPNCGKHFGVGTDGQVVKAVEELVSTPINVPAPSKQQIAQARFDRDVKLGKPVVEIPAGVKAPEQHKPRNGTELVIGGCVVGALIIVACYTISSNRQKKWSIRL